ncbi:MAG: hypothetical protein IJR07_10885 [Bacteroidaceae bacterium]|nr:hypothetical protein [Bacteroidaceae bacterium]
MEEQKEKRVLSIELDDEVKKVSITGMGSDEKVVMRQELSEDDLEQATGGYVGGGGRISNIYPYEGCSPKNG